MKRRNLKYAVMRLHEMHPDWTARQISIALDCGQDYVRSTAYRNGIRLRSCNASSSRPWNVKSVLPLKLLPVPIPALPEWNERIAAR